MIFKIYKYFEVKPLIKFYVLLLFYSNSLVSQNDIELTSLNDTLLNKLQYNLLINKPQFNDVVRIILYKNDTTLSEPVIIKQVYVQNFNGQYLVEDQNVFSIFNEAFATKFYIYKDEYSKVKNIIFKYISVEGSEKSSFSVKLYRRSIH